MKKFALALCVLLLTVFSTAAAEEAFDFSGYSLDELLEIRAKLAEEIASRLTGERMELFQGEYTVGEDIPAGVYLFKYVENGDGFSFTDYSIYESRNMFGYAKKQGLALAPYEVSRARGNIWEDHGETRINLYPGEYLILSHNGAEITRIGDVPARGNGYVVPEGTTIPYGTYTIGEEIPAGTYKMYFSGTSSWVRVFADAQEASDMSNTGEKTIILNWDNTESTITLVEGDALRVEYSAIVMTKSEGFVFD